MSFENRPGNATQFPDIITKISYIEMSVKMHIKTHFSPLPPWEKVVLMVRGLTY